MNELYIIGTGGAAKEIIQLVEQINASTPTFIIQGFIDLEPDNDSITFFEKSYTLYKEARFLETNQGTSVVIAHGTALARKNIFKQFSQFVFPNIIHPLVDLHKSVKMGQGNIIKTGCIITTDITIGDNNYINRGTQIGHDITIGSHNVLNPAAVISGGVVLGNINNIGASAVVLQYKKIGHNNTMGAGAVLTQDVADNKLLVGVPAKEISK